MNTAKKLDIINNHFRFELTETDRVTHIKLIGIIDEDTDFSSLLNLKNSAIVFHFQEVTSINSCGIRTWVNFMKGLQGSAIEFAECPPLIVRQMNMVPSFSESANISTVFLPYVCNDCEHEQNILMSVSDYKKGVLIPETMKCGQCDSEEMELDGNAKQYFAFAK